MYSFSGVGMESFLPTIPSSEDPSKASNARTKTRVVDLHRKNTKYTKSKFFLHRVNSYLVNLIINASLSYGIRAAVLVTCLSCRFLPSQRFEESTHSCSTDRAVFFSTYS